MKIANKVMTICAIIILTILGLIRYNADAIQYCTDEGGGVSRCREVSGWRTVVTGVFDEGGGNNPSGVCDAGLDFPRFRPGTKFVTFADFTCEGELIRTSFSHYCVGSTPPSVGQVIFSNCTKILEKVSGDGQAGTINNTLPQPLVVKVADSTGIQINWTITGPSGATGMSVSPATGTQVTVRLGNKSGDYTITATCPNCTSGSPQTFTARAVGCSGLTLDLFPTEVWPTLQSGSHDNTAAVILTETNPAPPGGCKVNFDVEPMLSQGHPHGTHPKDKSGAITSTCTIPEGFVTCDSPVQYTASQISGEEKITATLQDTGEKVSKSIFIMVPALGPLAAGQFYALTGSTGSHPDNHYGTNTTVSNIQVIARDYFENSEEGVKIGINDMSLIWGGLFDIDGNWVSPHSLHRIGKSVDVDHEGVDEIKLDKFAKEHGCTRYEVDKIHYECP